uniref:RRM domain-containing protein n=1 Tax=Echinostoma caproni TaxID=27848 RepID=A0A183AX53_9TREM
LEQDLALWNPKKNPSATSNPYNTMFVARLNYDTSESKLRREVEVYGRVNQIVLVKNQKTGKPRGYAFVEFEHERDMHGKGLGKNRSGPAEKPIKSSSKHENGKEPSGFGSRRYERTSGYSRDKDYGRKRRSRSRSRSHDRERRRSRSRDRHRRHRSPDHDRGYKRGRDRGRDDMMRQYGEYGAEIRAEYNGDM